MIVLCAVKRLPGMKLVGRLPMKSPLDILTAGSPLPVPKEARRQAGTRQLTVHCLLSQPFRNILTWHSKPKRHWEIWTDGACKCNPGIGGWGAYMVWGAHTREMYGGSKLTTNNQMELTAVISRSRLCAASARSSSTPTVPT